MGQKHTLNVLVQPRLSCGVINFTTFARNYPTGCSMAILKTLNPAIQGVKVIVPQKISRALGHCLQNKPSNRHSLSPHFFLTNGIRQHQHPHAHSFSGQCSKIHVQLLSHLVTVFPNCRHSSFLDAPFNFLHYGKLNFQRNCLLLPTPAGVDEVDEAIKITWSERKVGQATNRSGAATHTEQM